MCAPIGWTAALVRDGVRPVRRTVAVLLLALALTGCTIEIVPGSAVPASTPPTQAVPDEAANVPVDSTVDAAPGPDDLDTHAGDELGTLVGLGALELRPDRMDRGARS